jgi:hypothetical protein
VITEAAMHEHERWPATVLFIGNSGAAGEVRRCIG